MPNLGDGVGGGGDGWVEYTHTDIKRHVYGVDLTLIEPKRTNKGDRVDLPTELPAGVGFDPNRLKENSEPSEIASNIV